MAPEEQEIDLMELFQKLIKKWKYIFVFTFCAGVFGFIVALSIVKNYSVGSTLAPEVKSRTAAGGLSSLASMAGINLNGNNSVDAVYPELYPDIVKSNQFVVDLFSTPVEFMDKKSGGIVKTDYYTYLKEYNRAPWWSYVISAPMKALSWFVGLFKAEEEEVEGYANINPSALTVEQDEIAKYVREKIGVSVDNKTSIISVSVNAQHPQVAFVIAEEVIENIKKYISTYRTEKARKDVLYYEELFEEAKGDYYEAQQKYANYVDANQGVTLQRVLTERERLQNEMQLSFNLYNTCAQQLQGAKAQLQQDTPVFVVINPPSVPVRSANSRMMPLVAITFLGFCCACAWVLFIKDFWNQLFAKKEEE